MADDQRLSEQMDQLVNHPALRMRRSVMAIQFHENDVRDISVNPVSDDVYEIRLGDQVAAHIKSNAPFDASSIVVQMHT